MLTASLDQAVYIFETQPLRSSSGQISVEAEAEDWAPLGQLQAEVEEDD